jgi:hypothetical protein
VLINIAAVDDTPSILFYPTVRSGLERRAHPIPSISSGEGPNFSAAAIMTGAKTRAGVINIAASSLRRSCDGGLESPSMPFSLIAKQRGKAVGVVTTTRLTHATPAATYANSPERDWESDRFMTDSVLAQGCNDMHRS